MKNKYMWIRESETNVWNSIDYCTLSTFVELVMMRWWWCQFFVSLLLTRKLITFWDSSAKVLHMYNWFSKTLDFTLLFFTMKQSMQLHSWPENTDKIHTELYLDVFGFLLFSFFSHDEPNLSLPRIESSLRIYEIQEMHKMEIVITLSKTIVFYLWLRYYWKVYCYFCYLISIFLLNGLVKVIDR